VKFDIDLDRLLKLRLVVARYGEMDGASWLNTKGVLSRKGKTLLSRGFPKTHRFTRARLVLEVARSRSLERFPAVPNCATLWNLPAELEDAFDEKWSAWLEDHAQWADFIDNLDVLEGDLLAALRERDLLTPEQEAEVRKLRRSAEDRTVPLSGIRKINDETVSLLAAGFSRGEAGKPAVPYVRLGD
jgi:hypothetical protein